MNSLSAFTRGLLSELTRLATPSAARIPALLCVLFFASLLTGFRAEAREKSPLQVVLTVERVVKNTDGSEQYVEAHDITPGDVVRYTATFTNTADHVLHQVTPTLPIPAGLEYVADHSSQGPFMASRDGESFAPVPLIAERKFEKGVEVVLSVPISQYRGLRWSAVDLMPNSSLSVSARAVVIATP